MAYFGSSNHPVVCISILGGVGTWELAAHEKDKDIKVFTRTVDGTAFKEFRGITHIKTQVSAFVALLYDVDVATSWMHDVIEFKVIDSPSDTEDIVYTVTKAPWPIKDRDVCIRSVMTADAGGKVTSLNIRQPTKISFACLKQQALDAHTAKRRNRGSSLSGACKPRR